MSQYWNVEDLINRAEATDVMAKIDEITKDYIISRLKRQNEQLMLFAKTVHRKINEYNSISGIELLKDLQKLREFTNFFYDAVTQPIRLKKKDDGSFVAVEPQPFQWPPGDPQNTDPRDKP